MHTCIVSFSCPDVLKINYSLTGTSTPTSSFAPRNLKHTAPGLLSMANSGKEHCQASRSEPEETFSLMLGMIHVLRSRLNLYKLRGRTPTPRSSLFAWRCHVVFVSTPSGCSLCWLESIGRDETCRRLYDWHDSYWFPCNARLALTWMANIVFSAVWLMVWMSQGFMGNGGDGPGVDLVTTEVRWGVLRVVGKSLVEQQWLMIAARLGLVEISACIVNWMKRHSSQ